MICLACGHEDVDHDWTLKLCAGETYGPGLPMATKCAKECRQFVQYDTNQERA